MLLKSSFIINDTRAKSLQHLSNKSYNLGDFIKHKLVVTTFNKVINKSSKLFKISRSTLKDWGKK